MMLLVLKLLVLLGLANGLPLLVTMFWPGAPLGRPLDGGRILADGRPLFGPHKTLRGTLVMVAAPALGAPLLGLSVALGAIVGGLALVGDLATSFIKRRRGLAAGGAAPGFDQLLESLLPLLATHWLAGLTWSGVALGVTLFILADLGFSRLAWWLGYRQHPW